MQNLLDNALRYEVLEAGLLLQEVGAGGVGIKVPIDPVKSVIITAPGDAWPGRVQLPIADDARIFGLVPLGDRLRVSDSAALAATTRHRVRCAATRSVTRSSACSQN